MIFSLLFKLSYLRFYFIDYFTQANKPPKIIMQGFDNFDCRSVKSFSIKQFDFPRMLEILSL